MTTEQTYPFNRAHKAASYILQLLMPHCEVIHVAGSIRRMKAEIKDIEIVCIPKREFIQKGLFTDVGDHLIIKDFTEALVTIQQTIIKGDINGRYMQMITASQLCPGIKLDLFMPAPEDYYRMLAIRTGSADYSRSVIAAGWIKKGWCGVKDLGLRKITQCNYLMIGEKKHYRLKPGIENPELPPVWKSEGEFFAWLGVEYIDPEHRELHNPINTAQ